MSNPVPTTPEPARTDAQAAGLLRRPFAPGAIGFRAMTKVPHHGDPYGGAQIAAYLGAQSITQRLNHVVPGCWRQEFSIAPDQLAPQPAKKVYLVCRLIITLPVDPDSPAVDAVYEDVGDMDASSFAGLKALYSDARKRAAVAAGIGTYLYTALAPVVLPIGPHERQVQAVRRGPGKPDLLVISPATEQWLRHGYHARMSTPAVIRDLGAILAHGEPETGMGQGEAAEQASDPGESTTPAGQSAGEPGDPAGVTALRPVDQFAGQADAGPGWDTRGNGQAPVSIDFGDYGPPPAA